MADVPEEDRPAEAEELAAMGARWIHKDCGQPVMFDLSGAFCLACHAEGLGEDDVVPP